MTYFQKQVACFEKISVQDILEAEKAIVFVNIGEIILVYACERC